MLGACTPGLPADPCLDDSDCPQGYTCLFPQGICHRAGRDAGADGAMTAEAGNVDAMVLDRRGLDRGDAGVVDRRGQDVAAADRAGRDQEPRDRGGGDTPGVDAQHVDRDGDDVAPPDTASSGTDTGPAPTDAAGPPDSGSLDRELAQDAWWVGADVVPPSLGFDASPLAAPLDLLQVPAGECVIDTDLGTVDCNSSLSARVGPAQGCDSPDGGLFQVEVRVLTVARLEIGAGATLRVKGSRALAVLAAGPVIINGTLAASGGGSACTFAGPDAGEWCPGPGGFQGGPQANNGEQGFGPGGGGGGAGFALTGNETGGGGAGHAAAGGAGGFSPAKGAEPAQLGGKAGAAAEFIGALCGGSGGGGGGWGQEQIPRAGGSGGGGGGAVYLFSLERVEVTGVGAGVNASGGGGEGDRSYQFDDGAGGGGAGGLVVLEAPQVWVHHGGRIAVNGGGGGGRSACPDRNELQCVSPTGEGGRLAYQTTSAGFGGGAGGGGSVLQGETAEDNVDGTGGGGGGAGWVVIYTDLAQGLQLDSEAVSGRLKTLQQRGP